MADDDVYAIIQRAEARLFGEASEFSIETAYSQRDPDGVTASEIFDDRGRTGLVELDIEGSLDLAVASSRAYQDQREALYLAALNLTGEAYAFQPQLAAGATGTRSWLPEGVLTDSADDAGGEAADLAGRLFDERGTLSSSIGVGQMLLSGADVGVNIANDLLRYYTGDSRKSAVTVITANLFQPLLRGAGKKVAAERLTQAQRDVVYAVRDYSHFQHQFAAGVVVDYLRLLEQKKAVFNQYANYQSSVENAEYLRARSVDRADSIEVGQAEQAELDAKSGYIASVVALRNGLDAFKIRLGLPEATDLRLDDTELDRLREGGTLPVYLSRERGFRIALANRLPLMNEIDRFEDSRRQVAVAADGLRPGLDFVVDAAVTSEEPIDYANFDFRDVETTIGLDLDLPVDRRLERNTYKAALIAFEAQLRSLGETIDTLRADIDQRIRELEQFRQEYVIQQNAVQLAEQRVEAARLQFQFGTALFRDLQDALDALVRTQNEVTRALVDYAEARLNLFVELGVLSSELPDFWLREDSTRVDLTEQLAAGGLPESFLRGDEVIPPDELFPQ